jgi:hypothetical protein
LAGFYHIPAIRGPAKVTEVQDHDPERAVVLAAGLAIL